MESEKSYFKMYFIVLQFAVLCEEFVENDRHGYL